MHAGRIETCPAWKKAVAQDRIESAAPSYMTHSNAVTKIY